MFRFMFRFMFMFMFMFIGLGIPLARGCQGDAKPFGEL